MLIGSKNDPFSTSKWVKTGRWSGDFTGARVNIMAGMKSEKKPRFILSRRNQKGQVAVFVALIFQVVFVFFAMLINVGLLVHHKINLQQSTDLAAYYGAMKQAEILNVMAHVNYQIRQSWKLFTWRYRVLGTFGIIGVKGTSKETGSTNELPGFPVSWIKDGQKNTVPINFDVNAENQKCTIGKAAGLGFADVPFMCMGHIGFADWPAPSKGDETFCKIDCGNLGNAQTTIGALPKVGNFSWGNANIGGAINKAITATENNIRYKCENLAPTTLAMLGLYYGNYRFDTTNRKKIVDLLHKNLILEENEILDIEGKKIITGVKNTLENNLTEANKSSLTQSSITTFNGAKKSKTNEKLIAEIKFQFLNMFLFQCKCLASGDSCNPSIELKNLGDVSLANGSDLMNQLNDKYKQLAPSIQALFQDNSDKINTLGYEKNPWYNVYYGVKATSEPRIPFLPLSKIKLNAISFAKPFGGTIGPTYYNTWSSSSESSTGSFDSNLVDKTLPAKTFASSGVDETTLATVKGSIKITPNFSLYVGDTKGLSDHKYLGIYQGMLETKSIPKVGVQSVASRDNKDPEPNAGRDHKKADNWPKMSEWNHLTTVPTDTLNYDPLAFNQTDDSNRKNSYMRDIELTVVAPNQFDIAYYSIEPNFYQTYGVGKLVNESDDKPGPGLVAMANATNTNIGDIAFPHDFGSTVNAGISKLARQFNVSRQLQVVTELFATGNVSDIPVDKISSAESMFFTFIPRNPAALLSGWTYNDPRTYSKFPEPSQDDKPYTMQFGSCNDKRTGNGNEQIYASFPEEDQNLPAAPGNCVTGGRTGYSVKLISSDLVRKKTQHKDLGGLGSGSSPILNPVDENFLKFQ